MGGDVWPGPVGDQLDHRRQDLRQNHRRGQDQRLQAPALHGQERHAHHGDQGQHGEAAQRGHVARAFLQPAGPGEHVGMARNPEGQEHNPVETCRVLVLDRVPQAAESPHGGEHQEGRQQQSSLDPAADRDGHPRGQGRMAQNLGHGRTTPRPPGRSVRVRTLRFTGRYPRGEGASPCRPSNTGSLARASRHSGPRFRSRDGAASRSLGRTVHTSRSGTARPSRKGPSTVWS